MALHNRDYMNEPRGPELGNRWALLPVSYKILIINIVVFLLWQVGLRRFMSEQFTVSYAGLFEHGRVWTPITAAFSHESLWHLLWNMLFLHWFGPELETIYGRRNFLLLYLHGAVVSSLAHVAWSRGWGHGNPALGASGALMAALVVTAMIYPTQKITVWFVPVPLWLLATFKLVADLAGLVSGGGGISHAGHLGGAAAGVIFKTLDLRLFAAPGRDEPESTPWLPGVRDLLARLRPGRRAVVVARVDGDTAVRVDDLLRKIARDGMASLTEEELAFLKVASERYRGAR